MAQCICLQLTNKLLLTHPPTFPEERDKDLSKVNGGPLLNRNWNMSAVLGSPGVLWMAPSKARLLPIAHSFS